MRCLNCHVEDLPPDTAICPHCGVHLPSLLRDVLPRGRNLRGHSYVIDYPLGRGSYGITYRAHHTALDEGVAIKEFYPHEFAFRNEITQELNILASFESAYHRALRRFIEEGRILAKLKHPNVVQVRDLFEEQDTAYMVMDLIVGKTLASELEQYPRKKFPEAQILQIMEQLVDALTAIHDAGIFHLDLKPENILLTPERKAVLVDFGAAKQASNARHIGTRSYTESYAAPEIMTGGELGRESDIFELGMMLYEMLTGVLPPPALSRLVESETWQPQFLPPPWDQLVASALVLPREERPPTVSQWWDSRHQRTYPQPVTLRPSPLTLRGHFTLPFLQEQGMRQRYGNGWIKRVFPLNQEEIIVITAGGATLVNLSSGMTKWSIDCPSDWGAISPNRQLLGLIWQKSLYLWDLLTGTLLQRLEGHEKTITQIALIQEGVVVSGSKDETIRLWRGISGTLLQTFSEPMGWVTSVVMTTDGKWVFSGSQDGTIRQWEVESGKEIRHFQGHTSHIQCLVLSPRQDLLASGSGDRTVQLWDVTTGQKLQILTGHTAWITDLAFSDDQQYLASGGGVEDKTIRIWEVNTGKLEKILKGHSNSLTSLAFCPDNHFLLSGSYDNTLRLWDLKTGLNIKRLKFGNNWVYDVACSPDEKLLATANNDQTIHLWDCHQGREVGILDGHTGATTSVAFSGDGQWLVSGSWDCTLRVWDVAEKQVIKIFQGHQDWIKAVTFSPDCRFIASASWDTTVKLWEMNPNRLNITINKPIRTFKGHLGEVETVAFSPDNVLIVSGSHDLTLRVWEVSSGQELYQWKGHRNIIESVGFSPDGQFVLSSSRDKTLRLWHLMSGQQVHRFVGHQGSVTSAAFHPDGQRIASASQDQTIRLWDVMSGEVLSVLEGHTSPINAIAFTVDGTALISADNDGIVRVWTILPHLSK